MIVVQAIIQVDLCEICIIVCFSFTVDIDFTVDVSFTVDFNVAIDLSLTLRLASCLGLGLYQCGHLLELFSV